MAFLILNPNSSPEVTAAIADAAVSCRVSGTYEVQQIDGGPTEPVQRKWRQVERCGLRSRCVAIEPSHSGVLYGVSTEAPDLTPYLEAGRTAIARGADVLVLGCAGMVHVATVVERELGVPVIEPVSAGIREATAGVSRGKTRAGAAG